jgi:uncharacterized protein YhbP (UPF0306 family)
MTVAIRAAALEYLAAHHVMTLATHGDDGVWAAAVYYAHDSFDLYFLSAAGTRHARHFLLHSRVAAAIHENYADWRAIRGIQLEGVVTLLDGSERDAAVARYKERFPFVATAGELAAALSRVSWFRLSPTRFYYLDNGRGFGHREEVELP